MHYFPFIKVVKLDTKCAAATAGTVYVWPIYGIPKNHVFSIFFLVFLNNYESHLPEIWQECVNGPILTSNRDFFQKML